MPTTSDYPMKTVPGYMNRKRGIQLGLSVRADAGEEDLKFLRQLGVEWVMTGLDKPSDQNAETYRSLKRTFESAGLKIYRLANSSCHNMADVTLGLPDRDRKIEQYLRYIRDLGEAGIHYATYAHMANGIWSSEQETVRGGAFSRAFRQNGEKRGRWNGRIYREPLTHGRRYREDELWDNYAFFIRKVVPVAEDAGVYIGIHPDDPPAEELGGVPRCIFSSFEGYKKALEIASSPHVGVCLCTGCWLEGAMGLNLVEAVRFFGESGKLFKVHFRNVDAPLPRGFVETFPDEGYMDMSRVVQTLVEVGFDGAVIPDHLPEMVGGRRAAQAYAVGYIRGLLQAADA